MKAMKPRVIKTVRPRMSAVIVRTARGMTMTRKTVARAALVTQDGFFSTRWYIVPNFG